MTTASVEPYRYSKASIALHWVMLILLVVVYATILMREWYPRGSDIREAFKTTHFMLGLSVLLLVLGRAFTRLRSPQPPRPKTVFDGLATTMHFALYGFMIAMPVLGWLTLSAEGEPIPFFGLSLPGLVAPNEALAERVEELHELLGTIGYWMAGLHAGAALVHHYILRDDTLRRMLPVRT